MQMLNRSSTNRVPSGTYKPGFLDKAKAGIAHTSTIPGMGNKDLRSLQTLINEEKGVLTAHDRLANETSKASTALAAWGNSEGQDLSDVLTKAGEMLGLLSVAIGKFGERQKDIRTVYKSVRSSEEVLEETKKRRRAVGSRSEREEKKLVKMSAENKNLPSQTELLQSLRNEMRELDTEIMNEEAKLSDFKRQATKEALGIKFGALLELSEKATIVGELGKLLIEEIPLDTTPPGYGRAPYDAFDRTARLASEAAKCVEEVIYQSPTVELIPHTPNTNSFQGQAEASSSSGRREAEAYENVDFGDEPELPLRLRREESNGNLSQSNGVSQGPNAYGVGGRNRVVLGPDGIELPRSREPSLSRDTPPMSPAAAYRQSFHAPDATPLTRDDGYGNEIPYGEGEDDEQLDRYNPPAPLQAPSSAAGATTPTRPRVGGPRLSLGLGSNAGGGNFLGTAGRDLSSSSPSSPNPAHPQPPSSPPDQETFLPYASFAPPQGPNVSSPPVSAATPGGGYLRRTSATSTTNGGGGGFDAAPPLAPFARESGQSPMSEGGRELYVDAPEGPPDVMMRSENASGPAGSQYPQYDYSYDPTSPPPPPHSESARPSSPFIQPPRTSSLPPQSPSHHQSHIINNTYFPPSPTGSAAAAPSTATPNNNNEHSLAAAAAQREVEREMDSLAYTSASPSTNPDSYAPASESTTPGGGRKINAGAFFKRGGGGGGGGSRQFVPPASGSGSVEGDRGVSVSEEEEEEGGERSSGNGNGNGTQPLNVVSRRSREAAPPYVG